MSRNLDELSVFLKEYKYQKDQVTAALLQIFKIVGISHSISVLVIV